jgi:hypothetical protein
MGLLFSYMGMGSHLAVDTIEPLCVHAGVDEHSCDLIRAAIMGPVQRMQTMFGFYIFVLGVGIIVNYENMTSRPRRKRKWSSWGSSSF